MFREVSACCQVVLAFVSRLVQVKKTDADGSVFVQFHGLLEEWPEARRVAVGRKAHDLVLVCVEVKSEMQGHNGIENANGISSRSFLEFFELAVAGMINRSTLNLSHAIDDQDQTLVPTGAKIGACGVG